MKPIVVLIVIFILLLGFIAVSAQGIGQPLGPQPIGTPIPLESQKLPVWQAPWPPAQPTFVPTQDPSIRRAYVQSLSLLYEYNKYTGLFGLFVPATHTNLGETITVRLVDQYWAVALDGWYATKYVERWALRLL